MTRFLESKGIEAQLEARDMVERPREFDTTLSAQERDRLESVRLSKARIQAELAKAQYPNHRQMLKAALVAIEKDTT